MERWKTRPARDGFKDKLVIGYMLLFAFAILLSAQYVPVTLTGFSIIELSAVESAKVLLAPGMIILSVCAVLVLSLVFVRRKKVAPVMVSSISVPFEKPEPAVEVMPRVHVIRTLPVTKGVTHDSDSLRCRRQQELQKTEQALQQASVNARSLLSGLLRRKEPVESEADRFAASQVRRISARLEGAHPAPENELLEIERRLKALQ